MADNYSVPPPPPQANKPVPPPPPRVGTPASPAPVPPPAASKPSAPANPGVSGNPAPMARPAMPGMPMSGPSPLEQRMQEVEKRFQEQEAAKTSLESQITDLASQLKEEHEKVILQSLKAKEEEALSSKVEHQIRDMQEKLRREKHEQEILESRSKAENQLKDLERRLTEERESWMVALKNQLKEREIIEQDVEKNLSRRLREAEERFQDEKNQWTTSSRQKEEEVTQLRRQIQIDAEHLKEMIEEKDEQMEQIREASVEQRRAYEREMQAEIRAIQGQLDNQIREAGTWKAQLALIQTQLVQSENQRQEERSRAQAQIQRLEHDHHEARKRFETQLTQHEEDLKREYSRRDQERTQYWEGVVAQLRSEKETMRNAMISREEEVTRLQVDLAGQRRALELEKSRWKNEIEKIHLTAHEEALRNLPEAYQVRMTAEQKKWEQQHLAVVQQMKGQLNQSLESQKALAAKLDVDSRRAEQEIQALHEQLEAATQERERFQASLQEEQGHREIQSKQFMQRMAEMQMRESALREKAEEQTKKSEALGNEWQRVVSAKEQEMASQMENYERTVAELETLREEKNELEMYRIQTGKDMEEMRREIKAMAQAQVEWKNTVVQLQNDRNQREQEWLDKEKSWETAKLEWEKTIAELEKVKAEAHAVMAQVVSQPAPMNAVTPSASPEAAKALTAIRQQMQEMQTLLVWLRPAKKQPPLGKAA